MDWERWLGASYSWGSWGWGVVAEEAAVRRREAGPVCRRNRRGNCNRRKGPGPMTVTVDTAIHASQAQAVVGARRCVPSMPRLCPVPSRNWEPFPPITLSATSRPVSGSTEGRALVSQSPTLKLRVDCGAGLGLESPVGDYVSNLFFILKADLECQPTHNQPQASVGSPTQVSGVGPCRR